MENEQRLVRIQKNFKIMAVLTKIVEIFCYVGSAITVGGIITILAKPEWTQYFIKFDDDASRSEFEALIQAIQNNVEGVVGAIIGCALIIAMLLVIAFAMHKLGGALKKFAVGHSPFLEENIRTLKIVCIVVTIVTLLTAGIFLALLTALVLWTIFLVFQMGVELQKESDETL